MNFETGTIDKDTLKYFELFMTEEAKSHAVDESYVMIGLTSDNAACGAITGQFASDDLFVAESFFVAPDARGQGGGSLLYETLLSELHREDPSIAVKFSFLEMDEDMEALCDFLLNKGQPEGETDLAVYLLPAEDFTIENGFAPSATSEEFSSFEETDEEELKAAEQRMKKQGFYDPIYGSSTGLIDKKASVVLRRGLQIACYIAVEWVAEGICMLHGFHVTGGNPGRLKQMVAEVIKRLGDKVEEGTDILIRTTDPHEKQILAEAFPEAENVYRNFVIV